MICCVVELGRTGTSAYGSTRLISINAIEMSEPIPYLKSKMRVLAMALESLKAELALIMETFSNPPHDRFELYIQLKEKINEMRAFGMPPPSDLVEFEETLDKEFADRRHELLRKRSR